MDVRLIDKIKKALSVETVRLALIDYFKNREIDLNSPVYPPSIRDMQQAIPMLGNKIEIKPYLEDIDPTTNYVKIGWNLFVLGTHRMFLGYSVHESLAHLDTKIEDPMFVGESDMLRTPRQIISFILDTLKKHRMGRPFVSSTYNQPPFALAKLPSNANNSYYEKNKLQASTI